MQGRWGRRTICLSSGPSSAEALYTSLLGKLLTRGPPPLLSRGWFHNHPIPLYTLPLPPLQSPVLGIPAVNSSVMPLSPSPPEAIRPSEGLEPQRNLEVVEKGRLALDVCGRRYLPPMLQEVRNVVINVSYGR